MSCIFFLHVPKTAGQSFRKAAIDYFSKESTLLLYGEDSKTTSPIANQIFYKQKELTKKEKFQELSKEIDKKNIAFFSSHASSVVLDNFKPQQAAIFLRNPIERLVSHYNYAIKKKHFSGSFETFIETPQYQNLYSAILQKTPLDKIRFIGLTEEYMESIKLFNHTFNVALKIHHINKASLFPKIKSSLLSQDLQDKITDLNQQDFILYDEAKKLYQSRKNQMNS